MKDILKKEQPVFYKTLENSLVQNRLPHAMLLVACKGVDCSAVATFICQSIFEDQLACESCLDCQRIANGQHADVIRVDGNQETIKKRDIENIQERFSRYGMENKKRVYILENIDHATPEAMNSLLKTLEEPRPDIYAILTCEDLNHVLPTIQSRALIIHFKALNEQALVDHLVSEDVKREDALILSRIYDSKDKIHEVLEGELYGQIKTEVLNFLEDYHLKPENLLINSQIHAFKMFAGKAEMGLFLDVLRVGFLDLIHDSFGIEAAFCDHQELFAKFPVNRDKLIFAVQDIGRIKSEMQSNANLPLLMDRFVLEIL